MRFLTMTKTRKITFKIFLFERVKKKIKFFNTETYPLHIRLTSGVKTLNLKSYYFVAIRQNKYQQDALFNNKKITIDDIIIQEQKIIRYLLKKQKKAASLELIRQEYGFYSYDILHELDERFKNFLIDFFNIEKLPAYSLFIQNEGGNLTSEFILKNLEMSLQHTIFDKLLRLALEKAPPYIPLIHFFREKLNQKLPVFPVYEWQKKLVVKKYITFIETRYPQYQLNNPIDYINRLLEDKFPVK